MEWHLADVAQLSAALGKAVSSDALALLVAGALVALVVVALHRRRR